MPPASPVTRFALTLGEGQQFTANAGQSLAFSPDGPRLACVANTQLPAIAFGPTAYDTFSAKLELAAKPNQNKISGQMDNEHRSQTGQSSDRYAPVSLSGMPAATRI